MTCGKGAELSRVLCQDSTQTLFATTGQACSFLIKEAGLRFPRISTTRVSSQQSVTVTVALAGKLKCLVTLQWHCQLDYCH